MPSDMVLLKEAFSDMEWFRENIKLLRRQYEGVFVAIKDKSIVAFSRNTHDLLNKVKDRNINETEVIIQFIPHKNQIIIF